MSDRNQDQCIRYGNTRADRSGQPVNRPEYVGGCFV